MNILFVTEVKILLQVTAQSNAPNCVRLLRYLSRSSLFSTQNLFFRSHQTIYNLNAHNTELIQLLAVYISQLTSHMLTKLHVMNCRAMMWVHSTGLASITIPRSRKRRQLLQWKRKRHGLESRSWPRFFRRPLTTWLKIITSSTLRRVWVAASNLLPRCAMTPFGAMADFSYFMKFQLLQSTQHCLWSKCILFNVGNWDVSYPKVDGYGVITHDKTLVLWNFPVSHCDMVNLAFKFGFWGLTFESPCNGKLLQL